MMQAGRLAIHRETRNLDTLPRIVFACIACIFIVIIAGSCGRGNSPVDDSGNTETGGSKLNNEHLSATLPGASLRWYVLDDGLFVEIPDLSHSPSVEMQPWTEQERVTGFLRVEEDLIFGINDVGICLVNVKDLPAQTLEPSAFRLSRDDCLFKGRTIGGIFYVEDRIYCHVYRNTIFPSKTSCDKTVSLVMMDTETGRLSNTPLYFQEEHPEWEAVELFPSRDGKAWMVAWKEESPEGVAFRYSRYPLSEFDDIPIDLKAFIESYGFRDISRGPDCLESFLPDKLRSNHTVHFELHAPSPSPPRRYRYGPEPGPESRYLDEITVWEGPEGYSALLPEGRLRAWVDGNSVDLFLPELPAGYTYSGFWADHRAAVIPWEERHFPDVGAAGILIVVFAGAE